MKIFKKPRKVIDIIPPEVAVISSEPKEAVRADGVSFVDNIVNDLISQPMDRRDELEDILNAEHDPVVELAKIGAVISSKYEIRNTKYETNYNPEVISHQSSVVSQKSDIVGRKSEVSEDFYQRVISHIRAPASSGLATLSSFKSRPIPPQAPPAGFIVEEKIVDFYENPPVKPTVISTLRNAKVPVSPEVKIVKKDFDFSPVQQPKKKSFAKLFLAILAISGVLAYGLTLKRELVQDSSMALQNLEQAKQNLENFNFSEAAVSFQKSYADFSQAGQNLNLMGAGIAGIFSDLPGVSKISSAKNIVEAGKLLAGSGKAMSEALTALSQTGAILDPHDSHKAKPLAIIGKIKNALILSSRNFEKAKALISDIDETAIPEDKRAAFLDFKDKLPMIEEILADAQGYVDFLEGIVGIDEPKKYLLLFQNYSELRPTGGFPGTYGVVSFAGGGLSDFFVDDIYNLDGQLKQNIIPPKQLQHITPTLGMRDSAWFIDFPASARKAMWFFAQEAGYKVDGVIALNPDVVSHILEVVGPIEMPEYGRTLTAENFLANIQEEVEYGDNRVQPKRIVVDFAPRLLEKLYSAGSEDWTRIFNGLMASLEEKDVLFYFEDKSLEEFAVNNGFGGEIKNPAGDYLTVNFSNIKGSKTDIVTDSFIEIDSQLTTLDSQPVIRHKVTITRNHNGGDEEHGFYNRQNPAYVRVLMPKDAELISISGNDLPNFKPLVNYGQLNFLNDQDVRSLEAGVYFDKSMKVDKYEESNKKGIGFWMITDPGKSKRVEFEYSVPFDSDQGGLYSFYFQKQPGLDWKNFKFTLEGEVNSSFPSLNKIGNRNVFEAELKKDFELKLNLK